MRFIVPPVAGPARLVPLAALADGELSAASASVGHGTVSDRPDDDPQAQVFPFDRVEDPVVAHSA